MFSCMNISIMQLFKVQAGMNINDSVAICVNEVITIHMKKAISKASLVSETNPQILAQAEHNYYLI